MVTLGSTVQDSLTGFKGIAVGRTVYLYGCVHVCIQPEKLTKDGGVQESQWFDEQRVVALKEAKSEPAVSKASSATSGGPSLFGRAGRR